MCGRHGSVHSTVKAAIPSTSKRDLSSGLARPPVGVHFGAAVAAASPAIFLATEAGEDVILAPECKYALWECDLARVMWAWRSDSAWCRSSPTIGSDANMALACTISRTTDGAFAAPSRAGPHRSETHFCSVNLALDLNSRARIDVALVGRIFGQ